MRKILEKTLCFSVPSVAYLFLFLLISKPALAQPKPPSLERFFPAGVQRGESLEVSAEGTFERWPVEAWVDRPGLEVTFLEEKGKLQIEADAEAVPGRYLIRLHDGAGASSLRPFFVGTLPEVVEVEPNNDPESAQVLDSSRVVVNGRLERSNDVDAYSVSLKAGETLVAALQAHEGLGSPMDGVLQVVTPEGFVLAQEDDSPGLDPLLVFEVPADGDYILRAFAFPETPTSTIGFAGGEEFVYRLTLTTGGYADYAHPSAISSDETAEVEVDLIGWNIPESARRVAISAEAEGEEAAAFHPEIANAVNVHRLESPALAEEDVTGPIGWPIVISGRIDVSEQVDSYSFEAEAGDAIALRVDARSLGSPLDPVLRVSDSEGKVLEDQDDSNRRDLDPKITFNAPADGTYAISVRDLHGRGGSRYFYHLIAEAPTRSFELSAEADHFELIPGETLEITVGVERRGGFAEPIELTIEELPEGVTIEPATSEPKGDSSKQVKLVLKAEEEAAPAGGPVQIIGIGGERTEHVARLWLTVVDTDLEVPEEPDERPRRGRRR